MSLLLWHVLSGISFQATSAFWVEYRRAIFCSCVYLKVGYSIFSRQIPDKLPKRVAFIPTILSSALVTVLSLPTLTQWISRIHNYGLADATLWLAHDGTPIANASVAFFLTSLWADSIVSAVYFPGHMEILAGWIHHSVYIALTSAALAFGFTNGLSLLFIEEIPTFLLCLGQAVPARRSEMGFGLTFLATRVCFHSLITVLLVIYTRNVSNAWIAACLAAFLHCWWFVGWVQRQHRLSLLAASTSVVANKDTAATNHVGGGPIRRVCSFASTCASPQSNPRRRIGGVDTVGSPQHQTRPPRSRARTTPLLELTVVEYHCAAAAAGDCDSGRHHHREGESTTTSFDCDISLGSPVYMRSAGLTRSLFEEACSLSPKRSPGLLALHERSCSAKQYAPDVPLGSWAS